MLNRLDSATEREQTGRVINNYDGISKTVGKVEGWLTEKEGEFLFLMAKQCPKNAAIVEIGSWKGKSTICLAHGSMAGNNPIVYSIDPHTDKSYEEFICNIRNAKAEHKVISFKKTSEEAVRQWTEPIGFLFIDGNHEYSFVEKDFLLWFPFLIDGGVVAFHDSTSSPRNQLMGYLGPKKVVDKYIFNSSEIVDVDFLDTTTYAVKGKSHGRTATRLRNVKFKKSFFDSMLFMHSGVFMKLPKSWRDKVRVRLYGFGN